MISSIEASFPWTSDVLQGRTQNLRLAESTYSADREPPVLVARFEVRLVGSHRCILIGPIWAHNLWVWILPTVISCVILLLYVMFP